MILAIFLVLVFQLAGETLARLLPFPLPGPVIGFALLTVALSTLPRLLPAIRPVSQVILGNLSLLFVPAGVGIIGHTALIRDSGLGLGLAVAGSTLLAMAVSAWVFLAVLRLTGAAEDGGDA